jgi:hypothetical protein
MKRRTWIGHLARVLTRQPAQRTGKLPFLLASSMAERTRAIPPAATGSGHFGWASGAQRQSLAGSGRARSSRSLIRCIAALTRGTV